MVNEPSRSVVTPLLLLLLFGLITAIELTTNFVEKSAGAYLNWKNADREAWGTLWVKEASKRDVARQLDAETAEATRLRRKADLVNSFVELIPIMPTGVGVPITPAKFVELYRKIPDALQNSVLPASELAKMYWSNKIRRVSAWVDDKNLIIYLIDDRNRVIRDVAFDESTLNAVNSYGKTSIGKIENMAIFGEQTLSAENFFKRYYSLSPSDQLKLFSNPSVLLAIAKPITLVGIGIHKADRYGILGFESIGSDGYYVITFPVLNNALQEFINNFDHSDHSETMESKTTNHKSKTDAP